MSGGLRIEVTGECEAIVDGERLDVAIKLTYHTDDPLAVHLDVTDDTGSVRWVFALELLERGQLRVSGEGTVRVWPERTVGGKPVVVVSLRNQRRAAHLGLPGPLVAAFIAEARRLMPAEQVSADIAAELDDLLG